MPTQLSTHVLDTMHGIPAAGLKIEFWQLDGVAQHIKTVITNADGRTDEPLLAAAAMLEGHFELRFHVAAYFSAQQVTLPQPPFLDIVPVRFAIADTNAKYHVPLLVSPWAYSTYRGS